MTPEKAKIELRKYYENLERVKLDTDILIGIQGPSGCGKDTMSEWLVSNTPLIFSGTTSTVISRQIAFEENISYEEAHEKRHRERVQWRAKGDWIRRNDAALII